MRRNGATIDNQHKLLTKTEACNYVILLGVLPPTLLQAAASVAVSPHPVLLTHHNYCGPRGNKKILIVTLHEAK